MTSLEREIAILPKNPGIYKFYDNAGKLLYVGKSVSIKKRVASYFAKADLGPKTNKLVKQIDHVEYIKVFSEFEALLLESDLIRTYKPFYNIQAKDDKSPLYIKITKGEIPRVETTRKQNAQRGDYLKGPFPSALNTRDVLRVIRRIFPYCHHKNAKNPCLYVHLGLCPYPYSDTNTRQKYQVTIAKIKKLLSGKSKELMRQLKKEMQQLSGEQKYEEAQKIKRQIEKLDYITTSYRPPREFLERPTLVDDLQAKKLESLKNELNLPKVPKRIECYDISNISGKHSTGSMVVFTNGKSEKGEYRRFKIKFLNTPNDFEMIKQVLTRRFKNNWPDADLIIIDGGLGQLSSANEAAVKFNKRMPIVGLAKKLEEIYTTDSKKPISLPKESPARQLAQAIRDEAHRFAITYHRKLRSKAFLT
ncbi:MAG: excinuclease ABC subunit UvrC [Patescibacteria group bacterium]